MGTKSVLVFNYVEEQDFGNYSCRGTNGNGSTVKNIQHKPKGKIKI